MGSFSPARAPDPALAVLTQYKLVSQLGITGCCIYTPLPWRSCVYLLAHSICQLYKGGTDASEKQRRECFFICRNYLKFQRNTSNFYQNL